MKETQENQSRIEVTTPTTYGPIKQAGSLDGLLNQIGGKDKTVPVHILDEDDVD